MNNTVPHRRAAAKARSPRTPVRTPDPHLIIVLDGEERSVSASDFVDDVAAKLANAIATATTAEVHVGPDLLRFAPAARLSAILLISSLRKLVIRGVGHEQHPTLLAAIGSLIRFDPRDPEGSSSGKSTIIEVMAATDGLDPLTVAQAAKQVLAAAGYTGIRATDLAKAAQQVRDQHTAASACDATNPRIRAVVPDAPVAESAVVPAGWEISLAGIRCLRTGMTIPSPVVIAEMGIDDLTGDHTLTLAFRSGSRWVTEVVDRAVAADARRLVALAGKGIAVTSTTAATLVDFLVAYATANEAHLPTVRVSGRMGWQRDYAGFLLGRYYVTADQIVGPDQSIPGRFYFRGSDQGNDELAGGYFSAGTLEGWLASVKPLAKYPRVRLGLYASLTPPLLPLLTAPNPIIDYSGETTGGKSTTQEVAASVWGCPSRDDPRSVFKSWNNTEVYRERASAAQNHLPMILDDTKNVRDPDAVAKTIYAVDQGRGRGRGSVAGLRHQETFQTALISSGEQMLTAFTGDGGTRARAAVLWGSPFGVRSPDLRHVIDGVRAGVRENFGHAGPRFLKYILTNRDRWTTWESDYKVEMDRLAALAGENAVAARLAAPLAAVSLAGRLAHEALDFPWPFADVVAVLWPELTGQATDADRPLCALRYVVGWAFSHQREFAEPNSTAKTIQEKQPHSGWVGVWKLSRNLSDKSTARTWTGIAFLPARLEQVLREGGFDPQATVLAWRDRKWLKLECEKGRRPRTERKVRLGGGYTRMVVISDKACDVAIG